MPRRDPRKGWRPPLARHATGQGFCKFQGANYYFGKWPAGQKRPPAEVQRAYDQWLAEWLAHNYTVPPRDERTLGQLVDAFLTWAESEQGYRRGGKTGSEIYCFRAVAAILLDLYAHLPVKEFGSVQLETVRADFVAYRHPRTGRPWTRPGINEQVNRVRRIFSWGVWNGWTTEGQVAELRMLPGLRKKRTTAPESKPKKKATWSVVKAVLPTLRKHYPSVALMVMVHRLIGCRANQICSMRPRQIERDADPVCWRWWPEEEKTDEAKYYWIGPRCQKILQVALDRVPDPDSYVFPVKGQRRAKRSACYDKDSYNRAIERACKRAGLPKWSSGNIRHLRATEVREREYREGRAGIEGSQAVLRHNEPSVTERYAKHDAIAKRIQAEIG